MKTVTTFLDKNLIKDWRDAPRMYSVWALGVITTIQGSVLAFLTPEQLAFAVSGLPGWTYGEVVQAAITVLAITGAIGRLISQQSPTQKEQR